MKNILITGGAGFIGSNFIRYILHANETTQITNLDALTYAGSLSNLTHLPNPSRYEFVQGDINDANLIRNIFLQQKIDTIVHFAAETHVDRSIISPSAFIDTNIHGTYRLLEAAMNAWKIARTDAETAQVRFHHISTDEVYGSLGQNDAPFSERTRYDPRSPYSASKAASDHLVRAYHHTYQLPVTITNCSNNYGPYQHPEKFIPLMIINGLQGKPLPIYGDGLQVRDWLHVRDHCDAIYRVLQNGINGATYNIGGGVQSTNIEVVEMICSALDSVLPHSKFYPHRRLVKHVKDRPGHDRRYAMDFSNIQGKLGWSPSITLADGILQTVHWYLDHPVWVDEITNKSEFSGWVKMNYEKREGGDP